MDNIYKIYLDKKEYIINFIIDEKKINLNNDPNIKKLVLTITTSIKKFLNKQKNLKLSKIIEDFRINFKDMNEKASYTYNGNFYTIELNFNYEKIKDLDYKEINFLVEHELYHVISKCYKYENDFTKELINLNRKLRVNSKIRINRNNMMISDSLESFIQLLNYYDVNNNIKNEYKHANYLFMLFDNLISDAYLTSIAKSENNIKYLNYTLKFDTEQFKKLKKNIKKYNITINKIKKDCNNKKNDNKQFLFLKRANKLTLFIMACNNCPYNSTSLIHSNSEIYKEQIKEARKLTNDYFNFLKSMDKEVYHLFYNFYFYLSNSLNHIEDNVKYKKDKYNNIKIKEIIENKIELNRKQIIEVSKRSLTNYHNTIEKLIKEINFYSK